MEPVYLLSLDKGGMSSRRCLCHNPSLVCVGPLFSACGGGLFHFTLGLVLGLVELVHWLLRRVIDE